MLAYDKTSLDARKILENAAQWQAANLISEEKLAEIRDRYRDNLYSPNWAVRVGLYFFGLILNFAALGLMFMVFGAAENGLRFFLLLFGGGVLAALEILIILEKRHFRSGLDDVFLYFGLTSIFSALLWITNWAAAPEVNFAIFAVICGAAAVRYADSLAALASFGGAMGFVFSLTHRLAGQHAALVLPFVGMAAAAGAWLLVRHFRKKSEARFYELPLDFVDAAALLAFYACGNFFCLHTGAVEFFGMSDVPMPAVFWAFTIVVPLGMVGLGLRRRFRIMLDVGLFLVAMALLTVRQFHSVMPVSVAATLGGAVLLAVAVLTIRYLRHRPDGSFTHEADGKASELQRLQSFVIDRAAQRQQESSGWRGSGF